MKKQLLTALMMVTAVSLFALSNPVYAQAGTWGNGPGEFIDENGDGFNDLAPDADGDGIPNKYDEDYVKPQDGSGAGYGAENNRGNGPADGSGYKKGNRWSYNDRTGDGTGDCPTPIAPEVRKAARIKQ